MRDRVQEVLDADIEHTEHVRTAYELCRAFAWLKEESDLVDGEYLYPNEILESGNREVLPEGFYVIGGGAFGIALAHKNVPEIVFKLSFGVRDAWRVYAKLCAELYRYGKDEAYCIPRVYHVIKAQGIVCAIMERLEEYNEEELPASLLAAITNGLCGGGEFTEEEDEFVEEACNTLAIMARRLASFGLEANTDVHRGNIMYSERAGKAVLSDPFALLLV